jgi:ubiquitin-protein ligase
MVTDPEQYTSDYEQLKTTLELYPSIVITQVEGNPPDTYEIEYRLKGYVRNPDGSITTADLHKIRITLPFGYPHFAPTVKPLTHIFHPDIDPAAIRIADLWQKNPNLSDLVLSIGEMICGNNFTIEDPFNQEAADWYEQHRHELPLDVLQIADIDDSDERFDTLDEDAFSSLGLDDDLFDAQAEASESKVDLFHLQINQRNIFAAAKLLADIPPAADIPDREEIEEHIASTLKKADSLFKRAEEQEDQGQLDQAAETLGELEALVADYPGLEQFKNRILQSQSLADSFSVEKAEEEEPDQSSSPPPPPSSPGKKKKAAVAADSFLSVKALLIIVVVVLLLVAGGLLYMQDNKILTKARTDWQKVQALVGNRQFDDAQAEAETIVRDLDNLLLLKSSGDRLATSIITLLNSDDFQQGLLGNVKYDGAYVSFAKAEKLKKLAQLTKTAESILHQGKIRAALAAYQEALAFARKNELTVKAIELAQTVNNLRLEEALATAKKAEREKEWENAAKTYRRALQLSKSLADSKDAEEISKRLAAATFYHELRQSRQAFTGAQWDRTIANLEQAQKILAENPAAVTDKDRQELNQLLLTARLYRLLSLAREAYEQHDLTSSIDRYQEVLNLLETEQDAFGPGILESRPKIEKTLVMLRIARAQEQAVEAKRQGDLRAVLDRYQTILGLLDTAHGEQDESLKRLKQDIRTQIAETRNQLNIQKKIAYLKKNYKKIFKKHYPSFASATLEHPKVLFKKKIGQKMLFTMTCLERSQGSPSRLELQYLYDPGTGRWSLYTGQ